ncbi:MAG: 50S ribosomal protein L24 [Patescibacteria group bacterium]
MKFKTGDQVLVTVGKDKGKKAKIIKVLPEKHRVVVEGVNMYTRHMKPFGGQAGQKIRKERPLPTANIAIINDKGQADRIAYEVGKDGKKVRIFKKTGKIISPKRGSASGQK